MTFYRLHVTDVRSRNTKIHLMTFHLMTSFTIHQSAVLCSVHVTLNWVFTLRGNEAAFNLLCKMAATCTCGNYVRYCSCLFNKEQIWTRSLRNFPKCSPTTWSSWLERGGKKNAAEKSYKFFEEGYAYDVYACQQVEDFHVKARCYRSLRKSAEPHFLAVIFRECEGRAEVFKAHRSCLLYTSPSPRDA